MKISSALTALNISDDCVDGVLNRYKDELSSLLTKIEEKIEEVDNKKVPLTTLRAEVMKVRNFISNISEETGANPRRKKDLIGYLDGHINALIHQAVDKDNLLQEYDRRDIEVNMKNRILQIGSQADGCSIDGVSFR